MKTFSISLFLFATLIFLFTQCEKSPENKFDLSSVPGQYECLTTVWVPSDSSYGIDHWESTRLIPAWDSSFPCCPTHTIEIQRAKENQFTLTFEPVDTLLPKEITVEITGFREYSWDEIQADIRLTEYDLFEGAVLLRNADGYFDWFRYSESEVFPTVSFKLLFKSKSQDNIVLECSGRRFYD